MSATKEQTSHVFETAVKDVFHCGFLSEIEVLEAGVIVAQDTQGWDEVFSQLAERLPGILMPSKNDAGGVWICGGGKSNPAPHGIIVSRDAYSRTLAARECLRDLGVLGTMLPKPLFSVGACARALLAWAFTEPMTYEPSCETLLETIEFGFHACKPGRYVGTEPRTIRNPAPKNLDDAATDVPNPAHKPPVVLWDVKSYYYNMISRLPSVRVSVFRNAIKFWNLRPDERARWRDVLDAVRDNKPLRNTIAGACLGSLKPSPAFTSAPDKKCPGEPGTVRRIAVPGSPGPFRAAGLLVVRSGYELCQRQYIDTDAVYGTIDSVANGGTRPKVWESVGLTATIKAGGNAEVCHRGSYRIGAFQTKPYATGSRIAAPKDAGEPPVVLFYKKWL